MKNECRRKRRLRGRAGIVVLHLQVQVSDSTGVKMLQSLQSLSDEERHLLLHQVVVGDQVVEQPAVLQPDRHIMN